MFLPIFFFKGGMSARPQCYLGGIYFAPPREFGSKMLNKKTFQNVVVTTLFFLFGIGKLNAQTSTTDSTKTPFQQGGIYDRPYILKLGGNTAVGGYAEMNSNYEQTEGLTEGFSFEQRRFNIFLYSSISEKVKLTSELEFEHGTEEIALETALADILFSTTFNLRAGILLPPIGRFNITHDSPRYNVIDRPLVSTQIIPATLSEVGVGVFGALYATPYDRFSYEIYAVNGLGDGVVLGDAGGVRIPAGKREEAFAEDNNGSPALTGRLAYNSRFGGEFGLSFYSGAYNTYSIEGDVIDHKRNVRILAFDFEYRWRRLLARGEAATASIDIPTDHVDNDFLAESQRGFYFEGNYTFLRRPLFDMPDAALSFFTRFDYIDLNVGEFDKTAQNIGDDVRRITAGVGFRPTSDTTLRISYWRQWSNDFANNLAKAANIQFGLATYF